MATAMASDYTLAVYQGERHVGWLYDAQSLRFEYAPAWLAYAKAAIDSTFARPIKALSRRC
jgi:hypothetical protein